MSVKTVASNERGETLSDRGQTVSGKKDQSLVLDFDGYLLGMDMNLLDGFKIQNNNVG